MFGIERYRKRPLVVDAFQFTADPFDPDRSMAANAPLGVELCFAYKEQPNKGRWHVYNPGAKLWLPLIRNCYIIVAPTGCRYPVVEEQFERNYIRASGLRDWLRGLLG